jgi:hypothetical protein
MTFIPPEEAESFRYFWDTFGYYDCDEHWYDNSMIDGMTMEILEKHETEKLIKVHGGYGDFSVIKISYTEIGLNLGKMYDL